MAQSRRWSRVAAVLSLAGAAALAGEAARAQATPPPTAPKPATALQVVGRGRIIGVYDEATGDPIDSVEVRDMMSGLSAFTTRTGTLSLFFVDTGGSMMRFRKVGFVPVTRLVANSLRDTIPLVVTLAHAGQVLPTVVTKDSTRAYHSPLLRGFEERRKEGHGYFVAEGQLRKEDDHRMSDVLVAHIPGITLLKSSTKAYLASGRSYAGLRSAARCKPDVFIDGVRLTGAADAQNPQLVGVDVNQFGVMEIGAIEFYNSATIPPQFNTTGSGCGALLLWTREK